MRAGRLEMNSGRVPLRDMKYSPADRRSKTRPELQLQEVSFFFESLLGTATVFEAGVFVHDEPLKSH